MRIATQITIGIGMFVLLAVDVVLVLQAVTLARRTVEIEGIGGVFGQILTALYLGSAAQVLGLLLLIMAVSIKREPPRENT